MSTRKRIAALLVVAIAAFLAALAGSIHSARAAGPTLTIWTDQGRLNAVTQVANQWVAKNPGVQLNIVVKNFGDIESDVGTVAASAAPDVIIAENDWTGQLAANGLVEPIYLSAATRKQFPSYTLNAFSYGIAVKHLYGVPVQIENIGLVVNTKLAKVPTSWNQLVSEALAFKKKAAGNLAIAVQQGSGGDAYHMYPFFSGLGGYIFGTNSAGNLDPSNIGVANKAFLKNAKQIDQWNKEGLINSAVDSSTAQNAFLKGKAAFWVTGPWNSQLLEQSGIKFKIVQIPRIVDPAVPFLGVGGFMVTKYAVSDGNEALANDLVENYMTTPSAQLLLANAGGRYPANTVAGKQDKDPVLAEFGRASVGGVPMPNIPQMANVWSYLGAAWVNATKGSGATPATKAFTAASRAIADKIG
jgi:arabinogalactan oligomer / maltooligosaccharide transport system substrate-binding protein